MFTAVYTFINILQVTDNEGAASLTVASADNLAKEKETLVNLPPVVNATNVTFMVRYSSCNIYMCQPMKMIDLTDITKHNSSVLQTVYLAVDISLIIMCQQVTPGQTYDNLYEINATDPNDDAITYTKIAGPDGLTVDPNTGVVSWTNVQFSANDTVQISASDGAASATFAPQVAMCYCQNGGQYVFLMNGFF